MVWQRASANAGRGQGSEQRVRPSEVSDPMFRYPFSLLSTMMKQIFTQTCSEKVMWMNNCYQLLSENTNNAHPIIFTLWERSKADDLRDQGQIML